MFLRRRTRPRPVPAPQAAPRPPEPASSPKPARSAKPASTAPAPTAPPAPSPKPRPPVDRTPLPALLPGLARVGPGERRVLTPEAPVVMLNRVQSGVGALRLDVVSPHPLRLAVVFAFDGRESILCGPGPVHGPDLRRPAVSLLGDTSASLDLGRVRSLGRFLLLLQAHVYGGALVVSTFGGSRLEVPLPEEPAYGTLALVSGYVVRGALVVRAEVDRVEGGLREAARAHGYDELGWLDANTPLAG